MGLLHITVLHVVLQNDLGAFCFYLLLPCDMLLNVYNDYSVSKFEMFMNVENSYKA